MRPDKFEALEVDGKVIRGTLGATTRVQDDGAIIADLKAIISKKNTIIERQTDYIAELQEEIRALRSTVKLLTI